MKKQIKKEWYVSIVILLILLFSLFTSLKYSNNFKKGIESREKSLIECRNKVENSTDQTYINYCDRLENFKYYQEDFYSTLSSILVFEFKFLNPTAFLILVIASLKVTSKKLKYKSLTNYLSRNNYNGFIKEYLISAYKKVWLLPTIAFLIMFPLLFYTTFDPIYAVTFESSIWQGNLLNKPLLFIILYITNIFLYSFIFINISLIVVRKKHDYILAVILSYISYIVIELFLELFMNVFIVQSIFNSELGALLNIMNLFTFNTQYGIAQLFIFTITMCIISFFGVYLSYRNKEKLLIDCEKNE